MDRTVEQLDQEHTRSGEAGILNAAGLKNVLEFMVRGYCSQHQGSTIYSEAVKAYVETLRKEHRGHLEASVKAIVKSMPDEMTDDLPNKKQRARISRTSKTFTKSKSGRRTAPRSTACSMPAIISTRRERYSSRRSNTGRGLG
jgi:hypothetical protein